MTSPDTINQLIPEADFLASVVDLAQAHNWLCHHQQDSKVNPWRRGKQGRQSNPGCPDLLLVSQPPMRPRIIHVELKREGGKLTRAQLQWMDALGRCAAGRPVEVYLWYPSDWDVIVSLLGDST